MKQIILKKLIEDHYGYAEAVKRLRTNVKFCGSSIKVIAVTSSMPGEGKSDVTYALLQSFAQIGKKVILVDADIRKSVLVSRLEVRTKVQGLSEYLSGQCEMDDVICTTNYEGLDVVFAGSYSPNASELLEEERFSELICHLREMYDYVLIDTPPLGLVTDCAIVARHCDGIILVVEAGAISYRFLQKVQAQLEGTENRINEARTKFNAAVKDYNLKVRQFPGNIIAMIFSFNTKAPFAAEAGAEKARRERLR